MRTAEVLGGVEVIVNGWFDWAIVDPGPPHKVNGGRNGQRGMIPHSAEGYWPYLRNGVLWGPRRASWHASNLKDGRFYQHYPVTAQTWTSGAGYPNNNFPTTENEGVEGQPLTQPQIDNLIRMGRDLMAAGMWHPQRPTSPTDIGASLYEHNECTRFGAEGTSCPSDRIPWHIIVPALEEDMAEVSKGEFAALFKYAVETRGLVVALGHGLIAVAQQTGVNQQDIDALEAEMAAQEKQAIALHKMLEDD